MKSKNERNNSGKNQQKTSGNATSQDFDRLAEQAEKEQKRKPGSQGNSSRQHNNGRGGGK